MSMFTPCRTSLTIMVLMLAACGGTEAVPPTPEEEGGPDTTGSVQAPPAEPPVRVDSLPETKQDTILLEGMAEPITLNLFRTPQGFEPSFYTYYPVDFIPEVMRSDGSETVRFTANFGGIRTDEAFVELFTYPPGTTLQAAREQLEVAAEGWQRVPRSEQRYSWSEEEYASVEDGKIGRYMLGEHNGRFFHILTTYPAEMGDGFPPRAQIIFDQLRWLDDGSGLK